MSRQHIGALLNQIAYLNHNNERPWEPTRATRRLYLALRKLRYGSMSNKQIQEKWDRRYEEIMNADIDWGDDDNT